ncbi:MAG: hypothetical protein KJ607_01530, partial [Bacteroidetes bacterium]|nr:hypothetical protein [Bacteroidota bacterium]
MKTEKRKILTGLTLSLILIVQLFETKAQNIAITDDNGYYADSSAMLDVKSTTKGILIPRLTTSQRNNVNNPAKGLLIFDSDENSFFFYNGTIWLNISTDSDIWTKSGINVYTSGMTDKVGVGTSAPVGKLEVKADGTINPGEPIFEVINSTGDTVFAVYSEGVRIYVADSSSKTGCNRAGFAVGGFSLSKGITNEYLRVTPDSVRIYIAENDDSKAGGNRAGFAVGGFSLSKGFTNEYLRVTNDSTRIYTEDTLKGFGVQNIDLTKK